MSKLKLFEYVVLQHPTKEELEKGVSTKVLIQPSTLLGKDQNEVSMRVARLLPEEAMSRLETIDIVIRNF